MSESLPLIDVLRSAALDKINQMTDTDKLSIEELLWLIMFEGTSGLRRKKLDELKKLSETQGDVAFLNNLRRVFMLGAKEDGSFEINDELQKLIDRISTPGGENFMQLLDDVGLSFEADPASLDKLFNSIEAMPDSDAKAGLESKLLGLGITRETSPTKEQLEALVKFVSRPEHMDLRQQLTTHNILTTQKQFSKVERENFVESIRLFVEQKGTMNEMAIQTVTRLESEIDQMRQYVIMVGKTYNDTIKDIARKVGKA